MIARRLQDAADDLAHWSEFDYVVINDGFEQALADFHDIVNDRGDAFAATRPEIATFAAQLR